MKNNFPAIFLAIGLTLGGYFISEGIQGWSSDNRTITVKGVSEKQIEADQAFWPLKFSVHSADLQGAKLKLEAHNKRVVDFLVEHGIAFEDIAPQALVVDDAKLNPYANQHERLGDRRIILTQTLLVSSKEPKKVLKASESVSKLLSQGVSVSIGAEYQDGPTYVFTKLNDHKPQMIADAIKAAHNAAIRFADESNTHLGAMKRGSQGTFSILPRHRFDGAQESKQIEKTLRVVSTVTYFLD